MTGATAPTEPLILAFDSSGRHCAACLLQGDSVVATRAEEMARGQAERLMPMLDELLAEAGASWRDLGGIAVGVGPGNFTGIRISVSAARGLALALAIPAEGVSTFDAMSWGQPEPHLAAIPAPRDQFYMRTANTPPRLVGGPLDTGLAILSPPPPARLVENMARVTRARLLDPRHVATRPKPLYIKAADAAPPRDPAPTILP
ncbi:tRNA (adenosine(37)-N6)-threonylcarbamoyltransferase complex dimerization subunit type 1 TsaB [Shimia sp.]|uniref:tRNA (adenosine(37)-N6)-threonylcarbamoyltransferase complex dimerization subunit type 1 TsaB n=1 Tax=Shimia sp. TaxID=1954381 RepID=UPI00356AF8DC